MLMYKVGHLRQIFTSEEKAQKACLEYLKGWKEFLEKPHYKKDIGCIVAKPKLYKSKDGKKGTYKMTSFYYNGNPYRTSQIVYQQIEVD